MISLLGGGIRDPAAKFQFSHFPAALGVIHFAAQLQLHGGFPVFGAAHQVGSGLKAFNAVQTLVVRAVKNFFLVASAYALGRHSRSGFFMRGFGNSFLNSFGNGPGLPPLNNKGVISRFSGKPEYVQ